MQFHMRMAHALAAAEGIDTKDAARTIGRIKALIGYEFYKVSPGTIAGVYKTLTAHNQLFTEGLGQRDSSIIGEIEDGFIEIMWADAWATEEEEQGRTYPGENILDVMPAAPEEAIMEASMTIGYIEGSARETIDAVWERAEAAAIADGHEDDPKMNPEGFGSCLYYEHVGAGVSWNDDFPAVPNFRTPTGEIIIEAAQVGDYGIDRKTAVRIAEGYASMMDAADPGIILYSFSSLGGVIETEENRTRLLSYLEDTIMPAAAGNDTAGDTRPVHGDTEVEDIEALMAFIRSLDIAEPEAAPAPAIR